MQFNMESELKYIIAMTSDNTELMLQFSAE